jgi:hypothetical protein
VIIYYFAIKAAFFLGMLRSFLKSEPLQKHPNFLAFLYTAGLTFLSWAFLVSPQEVVIWRDWEMKLAVRLLPPGQTVPALLGWRAWQIWLVATWFLTALYYRLLTQFDEGGIFWLILLGGALFLLLF